MAPEGEPAGRGPSRRLTHLDDAGAPHMVDVGNKPVTDRRARASGEIRVQPATLQLLRDQALPKGDAIAVARTAGIMAAKRTAELIPLCHPLLLDDVQVAVDVDENLPGIRVVGSVRTTGRTGAEMEALTAVSVTLLTLYDMLKSADKRMVITNIVLEAKSGGRAGDLSSLDGI